MKRYWTAIMVTLLCVSLAACSDKVLTEPSVSSGTGSSSQAVSSGTVGSSAARSSSSGTAGASRQSSSSQAQRQQVTVLIPEGYCVPQIGDALQDNGVCSKADFLAAVNAYPFTEVSLSKIPYNPAKMCYRLEGYLYPDTYQFYKNMKAQDAIGKMLQNADSHIANKYSFQTVILASIIQREVPDVAGMRNVSAVFHNRLKDTKAFPYLGSDATVIYLTRYIQGVSPALMNKYKYFYNTNNRIHGLPAGPICSPGAQALYAAANPAGANYLYFWSDSTGKYYYSLTAQGTTSSAGTVSSKP